MRQSGLAGKFKIVTAKGGEHNIFDGRFVVRDFADSSGAGSGIVQPMRGGRALGMREIAGTGRSVPQPELGAGGVKVTDQHFQHAGR